MTTRTIKTEADREAAVKLLENFALPATLSLTKGVKRSLPQNDLQMNRIKEISDQLGWSTKETRAYCKLHIAVPILRAENPEFREAYDRIIKPHSYEEKLELMVEPFDFPVTRLFKTAQMTQYLDAMARHFASQGVVLAA